MNKVYELFDKITNFLKIDVIEDDYYDDKKSKSIRKSNNTEEPIFINVPLSSYPNINNIHSLSKLSKDDNFNVYIGLGKDGIANYVNVERYQSSISINGTMGKIMFKYSLYIDNNNIIQYVKQNTFPISISLDILDKIILNNTRDFNFKELITYEDQEYLSKLNDGIDYFISLNQRYIKLNEFGENFILIEITKFYDMINMFRDLRLVSFQTEKYMISIFYDKMKRQVIGGCITETYISNYKINTKISTRANDYINAIKNLAF